MIPETGCEARVLVKEGECVPLRGGSASGPGRGWRGRHEPAMNGQSPRAGAGGTDPTPWPQPVLLGGLLGCSEPQPLSLLVGSW